MNYNKKVYLLQLLNNENENENKTKQKYTTATLIFAEKFVCKILFDSFLLPTTSSQQLTASCTTVFENSISLPLVSVSCAVVCALVHSSCHVHVLLRAAFTQSEGQAICRHAFILRMSSRA